MYIYVVFQEQAKDSGTVCALFQVGREVGIKAIFLLNKKYINTINSLLDIPERTQLLNLKTEK